MLVSSSLMCGEIGRKVKEASGTMSTYLGATAIAQPPTGADEGCKHFWLIDTPSGPVSRGICKVCGEAKEFKNYLESSPWGDDGRDSASRGSIKVTVSANDSLDLNEE